MKNAMLSLIAIFVLAACSSAPPAKTGPHYMVGSNIDLAALVKPKVTSSGGGSKVYETKSYISPISEPDICFTSPEGFPDCTPSFNNAPGSETTTRYYVDPKGIVTEVYEFSVPIAAGGSSPPRSTTNDIKDEERYPKPKLTSEQKKSINDFYKNVHKQ